MKNVKTNKKGMQMNKGICTKAIISVFIIMLFRCIEKFNMVTLNNELAINQLKNDNIAFYKYESLKVFIDSSSFILTVIICLIFSKEIKYLIKNLIKNFKEKT